MTAHSNSINSKIGHNLTKEIEIPHNPFTGVKVRKPNEILRVIEEYASSHKVTLAKMYDSYRMQYDSIVNEEHAINRSEAHYLTEMFTELLLSLEIFKASKFL